MRLELAHVADPPDVVADAIGFLVPPVYFVAADLFAHLNGFEHGTVAVAATADVVNLRHAWGANEFRKRFDQIEAVNIIADLFSLVTENPVRSTAHGTDHQVRKKTMQLGPSVRRAGETTAPKGNGRHSEIYPVFLDKNVCCNFRRAEERMLRVIDTHRLRDTGLVFMARLYFPAFLEFAQRQTVRRIAIDFVR